jgi:hypothetical protein
MDASVRENEGNGTYELGAEIDGQFVPFIALPSTQVATIVQSGELAAQAEADAATTGA